MDSDGYYYKPLPRILSEQSPQWLVKFSQYLKPT